jgi:hypothetical protein
LKLGREQKGRVFLFLEAGLGAFIGFLGARHAVIPHLIGGFVVLIGLLVAGLGFSLVVNSPM